MSQTENSTPPKPPPQIPFGWDEAKWLEEVHRQDAQRAHDKLSNFHEYVNQAAIRSGETAIKMLLAINGGAAVSLLTFAGSISKDQKDTALGIANSLAWFAAGVALATAASALSYFTNYFMASIASSKARTWEFPYVAEGPTTKRYRRINLVFHIAAVVTAVLSLVVFVYGMSLVRNAIASLK